MDGFLGNFLNRKTPYFMGQKPWFPVQMFPSTNPVSLGNDSLVKPPCSRHFPDKTSGSIRRPSGYVKIAIENGNL